MRRSIPLLVAVALLALAAPASAAEAAPDSAEVDVTVKVNSFKAFERGTVARGTVVAELTDVQGQKTTVRQPVTVQVRAAAGGCKILTLDLDELDLRLLGLNVNLDKVKLAVTGRRTGGVLGRLFCRLASTRLKERVQAARQINARIAKKPMRLISVSAPISPKVTAAQAGTTPTCQVLSLVVGPLNLELLGLVVDLNQVKLNITATRGMGQLGDLFCQLANDNQAGAPQK
jgi:hypothetical protein